LRVLSDLVFFRGDGTDYYNSEKEELDIQLRAVPDIEKRIAELTAE
jgi:hypothetical protein